MQKFLKRGVWIILGVKTTGRENTLGLDITFGFPARNKSICQNYFYSLYVCFLSFLMKVSLLNNLKYLNFQLGYFLGYVGIRAQLKANLCFIDLYIYYLLVVQHETNCWLVQKGICLLWSDFCNVRQIISYMLRRKYLLKRNWNRSICKLLQSKNAELHINPTGEIVFTLSSFIVYSSNWSFYLCFTFTSVL